MTTNTPGYTVANLAELKAIPVEERENGFVKVVKDTNDFDIAGWYVFVASSGWVPDDKLVIMPDDNPAQGRYHKLVGSGQVFFGDGSPTKTCSLPNQFYFDKISRKLYVSMFTLGVPNEWMPTVSSSQIPWAYKYGDYTASADDKILIVNSNNPTITLPNDPKLADEVRIIGLYAGDANTKIRINFNGKAYLGAFYDYVSINSNYEEVSFIYGTSGMGGTGWITNKQSLVTPFVFTE